MSLKGKTTAARVCLPLASLCAAWGLAAAVAQVPYAQAAETAEGVTNPYTITIPATLTVRSTGSGSMQITGSVSSNHRLEVEATSANNGTLKLAGSGADEVDYTLRGATFTASAHDTETPISKTVEAQVNGTPRYEGTYTDTLTFTMSCVATHTMTLDAGEGTLPREWENPRELAVGEAYELPTPTRDGFKFDGWYTDASGGTQVSASGTMGNADVRYYAHWTANVLTINYHNGGAYQWRSFIHNDQVYTFDENKDCIAETETVGYDRVLGDQGDHSKWGIFDVGRLTRHGYHATNYWRVGSPQSTVLADGVASLANGKETAQHLGVLKQLNVGDVTVELYPVFEPNVYHIQYDANGGSGSMVQTDHTYDSPTALRTCTFERDGYVFAGWSTSADGAVEYTDAEQVNIVTNNGERVTLYAQWTAAAPASLSASAGSSADAPASSDVAASTGNASRADEGAGSVSQAKDDARDADVSAGISSDDAASSSDDDAAASAADSATADPEPTPDISAAASADAAAPSAREDEASAAEVEPASASASETDVPTGSEEGSSTHVDAPEEGVSAPLAVPAQSVPVADAERPLAEGGR